LNSTLIITEKTILGTVLYDPEALQRIGGTIKPEDFFVREHQEIWKVISLLREQLKDVNVLSVMNVLSRSRPDIDPSFLDELVSQYHVDVDSALTFSTQLVEESGRRLLGRELDLISGDLKKDKSFAELMSSLNGLTNKLASKSFASTELFGSSLKTRFENMLDTVKSDYSFIGIPEIDKKIFDFNPGELVIVAARPGVGKTASMLQSVRVQIEAGRTVGFIALEMPEAKLLQRLISAKAGVNGNEIARMSSEQFNENTELVDALEFYVQNEQLIIDRGAPYDIETIERIIRKMKYVHNVDVVYVDYIQLIEGSRFEKKQDRQQQVSMISRRLKNLATELELRMVVAAQLNRQAASTGNSGPILSHLRDSGALEQDASIIIFLYAYFPENLSESQQEEMLQKSDILNVKFEIAKQRNGPVWTFDLQFVKAIGVFRTKEEGVVTDFQNRETEY
jgi:replicative DNA helicase